MARTMIPKKAGLNKGCMLLLLCVGLIFCTFHVMAEEKKEIKRPSEKKLSPGMEYLPLKNNAWAVVPKGTQIIKQDGIRAIEGPGEYTGRRFEKEEEQIAELRLDITLLQEQVKRLKQEITEAQKDSGKIKQSSLTSDEENSQESGPESIR